MFGVGRLSRHFVIAATAIDAVIVVAAAAAVFCHYFVKGFDLA